MNSAVRYRHRYASFHYQLYAIVRIGNHNHDLEHVADNWNNVREIHILRSVANTVWNIVEGKVVVVHEF